MTTSTEGLLARRGSQAPAPRRVLRWSDWTKHLLLPPAGFFWLLFAGLAVVAATSFDTLGWTLSGVALGGIYALATPWLRDRLMATLDRSPALVPDEIATTASDVLVVLDAGRRSQAREYGSDWVMPGTLERLAYAAWLHRRLQPPPGGRGEDVQLPILVSGNGAGPLLATVLRDTFGVEVRWRETMSHNTQESAVFVARILRREGIERVVLVTHFWHMRRARAAFAATGLEVLPAPLGFARPSRSRRGLLGFVPRTLALHESYIAIHEWVGLVWYQLRYGHRPSTREFA